MNKKIKILSTNILIERNEEEKNGIIIVPRDYYVGKIVTIGKKVKEEIDVEIGDTIVYDKFPQEIKIENKKYDLISQMNIKYAK